MVHKVVTKTVKKQATPKALTVLDLDIALTKSIVLIQDKLTHTNVHYMPRNGTFMVTAYGRTIDVVKTKQAAVNLFNNINGLVRVKR